VVAPAPPGELLRDRPKERGRGIDNPFHVGGGEPGRVEDVAGRLLARLLALFEGDPERDHRRRGECHEHEQQDAAAKSESHVLAQSRSDRGYSHV
jgi:hypothetical protein